jgi:hypothetical protein
MSLASTSWLRWSPRILGCFVGLYLSLFALDATGARDALIHLSPAALVLAVVAVGWRWPALAGAGFIGRDRVCAGRLEPADVDRGRLGPARVGRCALPGEPLSTR